MTPFGFDILSEPLEPQALASRVTDPASGAYVSFEGWVRNHHEGRQVARLEYEAYGKLAIAEGQRIIDEAREKFGLHRGWCVHRTGALAIGDCAVWVGVSTPHRDEGFQACRYIIDAIKARVPVWKKEHYADGTSDWVNCARCAAHAQKHEPARPDPDEYYARQMVLPEVGLNGQARLAQARVVVVGAGGLSCGALPYLAAAGCGHITIVDSDSVEVSNLHRQTLFTVNDLGAAKAECAAMRLAQLNPFITLDAQTLRLDRSNSEAILAEADLVLDCTDNLETKFLLNDAAVHLGKTLIAASIHQYEGQLFMYKPGGPCLRCLWPEIPPPDCVDSCAEAGVLGVVPGVFGAMQAMESLKHFLGLNRGGENALLLFDLLSYKTRRLPLMAAEECPTCGDAAGWSRDEAPLEIALHEAQQRHVQLCDMRTPETQTADPIPNAQPCPPSYLQGHADPDAPPLALICDRGLRSRLLAKALRERGMAQVYSIRGGAQAIRDAAR